MNLNISNTSGQPIYDQIATQLKNLILSGELHEGDALPSMRMLAKELRISVITTKRAYEELERDGFVISMPGRGSFVAPQNLELLREDTLRKIETHMQEILQLAPRCNLTLADLIEMLRLLEQGD